MKANTQGVCQYTTEVLTLVAMNFGERLRLARINKSWSQVDLSEKSGVSQATISKIERGDQERSVHTPILAAALEVDTLWLTTGESKQPPESLTGLMFRKSQHSHESQLEQLSWPLGKVPLISSIQAGHWCEAIDNFQPGDAEEWLPAPTKHGPHAYALRVTGTSMEPRLREGEIVVVDPDRAAESGSIVVARKTENKEVTLKQLIREGGDTYLKAINPHWPEPIIRLSEEWTVCGRVICKIEIF